MTATRASHRAATAAASSGGGGGTPPLGVAAVRHASAGSSISGTGGETGQLAHVALGIKSRGPSPPTAASSGRQTTVAQQHSRHLFYQAVPQHVSTHPLRSPYDGEIWLLFLPALIAGVLEPIQQTAESILLGALGLGTVLFQFAVGFLACLIIATTPRVAAHSDNKALASRATAQGMWVAVVAGVALQAAVWAKAPDIITFMSSSDATVASLAVLYLRARSWGLPAALVMMIFHVRDMACLPGPADVRPYARMTAPLAVNNLSALLPTLVATSAATALGVQHLGAHTILRQVMGFWLQLFIAFNATAHSLIANSLSRQREGRAAEVLVRIAQLAVAVSLPLAAALFAGRGLLPDLFTEDVLVQREVAEVLPFLLLLMPLDALGTVLEGGLLGASDTGYLGARTAASCAVSLLVLGIASLTHGSLLALYISSGYRWNY
ncbi:hypothetical protein CHLNCDRAFT_134737 [Chlorella variabilis]|uniref:Multidrug and toxic compound extrusion protein n=1 Tax=Chlorella variabilis TaxID=554065 RepID=E1ZGN1_CHLVA|nr:hypothetical protein CHLNCDRAFT_134737 [Chlorella variabilis]EFN54965.1 hypothetical protein CHLNCDRAFT_134737 [Chlorella variabilis]|eukprot:XP_005847067.1 hypothetical protein CHLNCDRAFT_134737 [Chlorella variabilis]